MSKKKISFEDEDIVDWEKLMESVKYSTNSIAMSKEIFHRNCLGPSCNKKFKTKHRYVRLCEYCRRLEMYKSGLV